MPSLALIGCDVSALMNSEKTILSHLLACQSIFFKYLSFFSADFFVVYGKSFSLPGKRLRYILLSFFSPRHPPLLLSLLFCPLFSSPTSLSIHILSLLICQSSFRHKSLERSHKMGKRRCSKTRRRRWAATDPKKKISKRISFLPGTGTNAAETN